MGFYRTRYVLECCIECSPAERLVLYALAARCGDDVSCYPSLALIATDTGLDRATVISVLRDLEAAELITVDRYDPKQHTKRRSNTYTFVDPIPAEWLRETTNNGRVGQPLMVANSARMVAPGNPNLKGTNRNGRKKDSYVPDSGIDHEVERPSDAEIERILANEPPGVKWTHSGSPFPSDHTSDEQQQFCAAWFERQRADAKARLRSAE
jgi:Helix-turn-helix domain